MTRQWDLVEGALLILASTIVAVLAADGNLVTFLLVGLHLWVLSQWRRPRG